MPRAPRRRRRSLEWSPHLVNCLRTARTSVDEPGHRDWLQVAYRTYRRRILSDDYLAEAVVVFETDPELVARAQAAVDEHRRRFWATYGHLRADA